MTENEMDAEFGKLLRERAAVKQAIACLKSKLLRSSMAFRTAATAIEIEADWALPDDMSGGLVVPSLGQSWPKEEHTLPALEDLTRWLREKRTAEGRLEKINELLPD